MAMDLCGVTHGMLRFTTLDFEDYYLVMRYFVCLSSVTKFLWKPSYACLLKNVDVASKSFELLNLLHDYCIPGLECYML